MGDGSLREERSRAHELGLDATAFERLLAATGPLAVVDLETTGLADDAAAEIVEVGVVLFDRSDPSGFRTMFVGLDNFVDLLTSADYGSSLAVTFFFSFWVVVFGLAKRLKTS